MPADIDAEENVVGSLLIDEERLPELMARLSPTDFYREKNAWVYEAMIALAQRHEAVNQITVAHEMAKAERIEAAGGPAYLSHLVATCVTSIHVMHYAGIVERCALARRLIMLGDRIQDIGYREDLSDESLTELMKSVSDLMVERHRGKLLSPMERATFALQRYGRLREVGAEAEALPFGLRDLDSELGGAFRGDFIVVGARPRIGKSSLLQGMANSMTDWGAVLFCSAEMTRGQLTDRDMVPMTAIPLRHLRRGGYTNEEWSRIQGAVDRLSRRPVWLFDDSPMTTAAIEAAARELAMRTDLVAIFVDYLQLLGDLPGQKAYERVTYVSGRLKQIARALNIPLVAASQLSRESEKAKRRPQLSDLRESGAIEQDADVVLLLHREDAYFTEEEWKKAYKSKAYPEGVTDIKLAKDRQGGASGTVKVAWLPKLLRYGDLTKRDRAAEAGDED